MANFRQDNRRSGGGGSYRGGNRRDSGERRMFDAVCAECGKDCKVPFQASSDKPVYCSNCFENKGNQSSRSDDRRGGGRRDTGVRDTSQKGNSEAIVKLSKNIETLNTKIDSLIGALSNLNITKDKKAQDAVDVAQDEKKPAKEKKVKTKTSKTKEPKKKTSKKASKPKTKK